MKRGVEHRERNFVLFCFVKHTRKSIQVSCLVLKKANSNANTWLGRVSVLWENFWFLLYDSQQKKKMSNCRLFCFNKSKEDNESNEDEGKPSVCPNLENMMRIDHGTCVISKKVCKFMHWIVKLDPGRTDIRSICLSTGSFSQNLIEIFFKPMTSVQQTKLLQLL